MFSGGIFRFGAFVLDRSAYRLLEGQRPIELSPKAVDLLHLFVTRPGALVTKDDMLAALWPGIAVTDNALTQVVSELRQALGDQPAAPRFVQTVPRRGYRFIADVLHEDAGAPASPVPPAASRPRAVLVSEFANVTGDADVAWLAAGIAETLTNDLRALHDVHIIDRAVLPAGGRDAAAAAAALRAAGVDLLVTGSYQRAGDRLRVTARAIDVRTHEAVAQAKADGAMADVFAVQDDVVRELSAALRLTVTPAAARRISARETSSLEAYRAVTEGRIKLETLDLAAVPGARADFERAIALDPNYALAHVGLAHAEFWRFQASRARTTPDRDACARAIAHARRAAELDPELAEAHGALAMFLASVDRPREAITAGRIAVALEAANWRHQFRLGVAEWGSARLSCLDTVAVLFPAFAYAHFAAAMVHVARSHLDKATATLGRGVQVQEGTAASGRFPGRGLHWLRGLIHLSAGDHAEATRAFERELAAPKAGMFADEYDVDAHDGLGFVALVQRDGTGAAARFSRALERDADHARSLVGLAEAAAVQGHRDRAGELLGRAAAAIDTMTQAGRDTEVAIARAYWHLAAGRADQAVDILIRLLHDAPPGSAGWTLPVEPWFADVRKTDAGRTVLDQLAARAG
jgi:DNA-binding winged helix-turn-helix (wHTH) protein/tetratricopeptide (TPR) repeat protein